MEKFVLRCIVYANNALLGEIRPGVNAVVVSFNNQEVEFLYYVGDEGDYDEMANEVEAVFLSNFNENDVLVSYSICSASDMPKKIANNERVLYIKYRA